MKNKKNKKFKIKPQLLIFYVIGLLVSFSAALPAYVNSNFITQFSGVNLVGLFFIVSNFITLLLITIFPKTIKRFGKRQTFKLLLFLYSFSLFFFSLANSKLTALLGIIFFTAFSNLALIKLDVFIEAYTDNNETGKVRAIYLTICNAGWVIAPALSAFLIGKFNYNFIYWLSGTIVIPTLIIFLLFSDRLNKKIKYEDDSMKKVVKKMFKNVDLRGIFFVALILQLFYSTAIVYIPVYLHQTLHMSWEVLGPIFSFMLVPFIIFQIPAGYLADKYFGEKEMLYIGLFIISISLIATFYFNQPTAWVWAVILFASRIGAALVEAMRESYFFKIVDAKDLSMINLFRLTTPLAYVIGPIIATVITFFLPINYIFVFFALLILSGMLMVWPIKDSL